jgi:uncharacterized protein
MNHFIIDLATLRPNQDRVEVEEPARELGLDDAEWRGAVRGVFRVERSGESATVRGTVSSSVHVECVRCLREFDLAIEAPVVVLAERSGTSSKQEQRELERGDHMLFHDGRRLDLRETAREALLLELPISPHCREDCPGLCPRCGADRNDGPCACADRE